MPPLNPSSIIASNVRIWSRVDLPFRNPAWLGGSSRLVSRNQVMRLVIILSINLLSHEFKDIGLKDSGSAGSLFGFRIGHTVEDLHCLGTKDWLKDRFSKCFIILILVSSKFFNISLWIRSSPIVVCLSLLIALFISCDLIGASMSLMFL